MHRSKYFTATKRSMNKNLNIGDDDQHDISQNDEKPPKLSRLSLPIPPHMEGQTNSLQTGSNRKRLDANDYRKPTVELAKYLLGKRLVHNQANGETLVGKVVETEAYPGVSDEGSHSYGGKRTSRTEAMFKEGGWSYVYSIYGMYVCMNITSNDFGGAVLLRALQPLAGLDTMQRHRGAKRKNKEAVLKVHQLCSGPAKLCQSMAIDRCLNMSHMVSSDTLYMEEEEEEEEEEQKTIVSCRRIGISGYGASAAAKPFRFYIQGNIHVSQKDKLAEKELIDPRR